MLWLRYCKVQMVNSEYINDKMVKCTVWCLAVLFTLLEVFVRTQISLRDTTHGFIQNNNEVRYLVDDISTIHKEFAPGVRNTNLHDARLNSFLRFEPEFLDFKERPLGVPHLEKVTLFNVNNNKSLDMTSISGNTVHFHSSFFEDKKIPPLGNTTFNVVFLGREEGEIESSLFIHTTEGSYKYQVRGASVASPYRLRPIVDIRIPVNATFSPLIYMHNPHTEPIQIVEVYSSGGEFHLELPTGELEGPKGMWEIPPFHTKPIIRVRFNARAESNYTAYVRIKVSGIKDVLVVPVEVEVSSQCALYTQQGTIDFGVGGTLDKPKQVKLAVYNVLKKPIKVHNVTVTSYQAISVDFQPIKLPPDTKEPIEIATLTLNWKSIYEKKDFFGKILIKYKQGNKNEIEIPYWATVFEGGLHYNASVTKYLTDKISLNEFEPRNFTVSNNYEYSLAITNITLPKQANAYFSIKKFQPIILKPTESVVLFQLILKSDAVLTDLKLKSLIVIHTNISDVEVPLLSYNGKLTLIWYGNKEDRTLDLGLVGSDSSKESHFILLNNNPIDVKLLNFGTNIQSGSVNLVGCAKDDYSNHVHFPPKNMSKCTYLKSGEYGVFRVSIQTSKSEGQVLVQTFVQTQFEKIIIPIRFKVAQGKLEIGPDRLVFDECFPGKICTHPLRIHSTFIDSMMIESISSIPPDPRLSSSHSDHITARSAKVIGHLYLDPVLGCQNHCYTGLSLNSSIGGQWLKSFSLPSGTCDLDLNLLNIFYGRYLNLTSSGKKWQNLTLRLDTTEVKGHFFHTRVKMSWPKLVVGTTSPSGAGPGNRSIFVFPLTQIGNITYKNITIRNPSNAVLTLQLVMDWMYPQAKNLFKNLPFAFMSSQEDPVDSHAFFFHEMHNLNRSEFEREHDVFTHEKTLPITIPARETVSVTVGFKATVSSFKSALIYIRNNLTILEVIRLTGQGAHPNFKFGNRKPGSVMPLMFELTEKHLKDCEKEKHRKNPSPNLTVKRSFTARNTGDITITVHAFFINRFPCEGYGFKVLNCMPFDLAPNATRKIDIAFTPDFTLSKIHRTLILHTSLNLPVNYTLVTTVPSYFLAPCASVLARPNWEPLLYYACVSLMTFLLFIVVSVCFIESDRILRSSLNLRNDVDSSQPLDLRLIGNQTRDEIRTHKTESDNEFVTTTTSTNLSTHSHNKSTKDSPRNHHIDNTSIIYHQNHVKEAVTTNNLNKCDKLTTKKKINQKKNSVDNVGPDEIVHKKTWNVFSRNKQPNKQNIITDNSEGKKSPIVNKVENNSKKVSPVQKDAKKKNCLKKKIVDLPCSEEETSSTTTESSNNDEIEKFNDSQTTKTEKNKKPVVAKKNKCDFRDNYEGDGEDEDFEKESNIVHTTTTNRWKSKTDHKTNKDATHDNKHSETSRTNNTSTNTNIQQQQQDGSRNKTNKHTQRERKEKSSQKRRSNAEKNANKTHNNDITIQHAINNSNVRVSPPIPPIGVWGENRATFSDVVARSDTNLYTTMQQQPPQSQRTVALQSKPTLYVEPTQKQQKDIKSTSIELGPIGPSKKTENLWLGTETTKSNCYNILQQQQQQQQNVVASNHNNNGVVKPLQQLSNSFFTEPQQHNLATMSPTATVDNQNSYFDVPEIWSSQTNSINNLFQNSAKESVTDVPSLSPFQENWNHASFWEPLCTPVGDNRPPASHSTDYFWGSIPGISSSTWSMSSPWTPVNNTPDPTALHTIRSPPGFIRDDHETTRVHTFDPFSSLSNIWTPHSPDSWNYNPNNSQQ